MFYIWERKQLQKVGTRADLINPLGNGEPYTQNWFKKRKKFGKRRKALKIILGKSEKIEKNYGV